MHPVLLGLLIVDAILLLKIASRVRALERAAGLSPADRAQSLVGNVRRIARGDSEARVRGLLGEADVRIAGEWLYNLDENAGYLVAFDADGRVAAVKSWKT